MPKRLFGVFVFAVFLFGCIQSSSSTVASNGNETLRYTVNSSVGSNGNETLRDGVNSSFSYPPELLTAEVRNAIVYGCDSQKSASASKQPYCYDVITNIVPKVEMCYALKGMSSKCYTAFAIKDKNLSICNALNKSSILPTLFRDCLLDTIVSKGDAGLCYAFPAENYYGMREFCIDKIAVDQLNESMCSYHVDEYGLYTCVRLVADEKGVAICKKGENATKQNPCLSSQGIKSPSYASIPLQYETPRSALAKTIFLDYSSQLIPKRKENVSFHGLYFPSSDWQSALEWLKKTPKDSRVLAWWDYGSWLQFFAEKEPIISDESIDEGLIHGTARALVHGNPQDLFTVMEENNASYLVLDSELILKWRAVIFLSGTCSSNISNVCPEKSEINASDNPGYSKYEQEKSFGFLFNQGNCVEETNGFSGELLKGGPAGTILTCTNKEGSQSECSEISNETWGDANPGGAKNRAYFYCKTKDRLQYLNVKKKPLNYSRTYNTPLFHDQNSSFLLSYGVSYYDLNPDFSSFGLNNSVFDSAFTQLYFFNDFPRFELAFTSPNSSVKIFKYIR